MVREATGGLAIGAHPGVIVSVIDGVLRWLGALPPDTDREERQTARARRVERISEVRETERTHHERVEKARAMLEAVRASEEDPPLTFEDFMHAIEGAEGPEGGSGGDADR